MKKIYVLLALSLLSRYVYSQNDASVYCLENDIVNHYLNDFSYDDYLDDYDTSMVMDYFNRGKEAGYRMDAPKPVPLSWTKTAGAESQRIEVSESSDFADALVYYVSADAESYDVYNLIPGRKYYYRVVSTAGGADTTVGSGDFETSGALRMILADGTWNVRDAGGWISSLTGKPIAYGKIFRGAQLKAANKDSIILSAQGIEAMRQVGIRAELDLRSSSQVPSNVSALAKKDAEGNYDVDFVVIPEAVNARMYHFANNDATIRELQWIINRLKQNKPVYYHCQNGADRTGTLGFLIGALLGMSEGDLAKDYELTTFCEPIAAAYDPTEVGFARLRNYEGKKGSPIGSSEDNKEYMFAELANTMKSVAPVNGSYHEKIYNFFRTGVNGTSISAADLSWFIMEMTGYPMLGGINTDVDTLRMDIGDTHKIDVVIFPDGATYSKMSFKSTCDYIATVTDDGVVTAVGGGSAYIIADVDGIEKFIPVIVPLTSESLQSYSMYNDIVDQYMNEAPYSSDDYSVSYIDKYVGMSLQSGRTDWPQSFKLKWSIAEGATNLHLYISEKSDFLELALEAGLSAKDSTYMVSGLDAGRIYYYKITATLSGKTVALCSSAFRLSSTVKMIKFQELYNVRDMGGWTGLGGKTVKYGLLYRGSRLRRNVYESERPGVAFDEAEGVRKMGVNAELDLRRDDVETKLNIAATYRRYPYKRISDAGDCLGGKILSGDAYIVGLQQIIDWLKLNKIIYFSGSLGAERTGAMAFLINGLLGVNEDGLARDYELSSFTCDNLAAGQLWKRNEGNYPAMVSAIKTLDGVTLQEKIYNYFKVGVNGTAITSTDLDWFIDYMLEEVESPFTDVEPISIDKPQVIKHINNGKIYNMFGFEAEINGPGLYIIDGKTVYVTE